MNDIDETRKRPTEPDFIVPILKTNVTLDLLGNKQQGSTKENTAENFLPTESKFYPGKLRLDNRRDSMDDDHATRRAKARLNLVAQQAESSPTYHLTPEEADRIARLRNFQVNPKEVERYEKQRRAREEAQDREHFMGYNLAEMIVAAKRDPFATKKQSSGTFNKHMSNDRLRESEEKSQSPYSPDRQYFKDLEESRRSLSNSDFRRKVGQTNLMKKEFNLGARKVSRSGNSVIGINDSEYIDDEVDNLDITGSVASLRSDEVIEDLAASRSYSSRARPKSSRSRGKGKQIDEQSIADESFGFGFIQKNKQDQVATKAQQKFEVEKSEASESDSFGVRKNRPALNNQADKKSIQGSPDRLAKNRDVRDSEVRDSKMIRSQKIDDPLEGLEEFDPFDKRGRKKQAFVLELDPKIYEDITDKYEYVPKEPEIHRANGPMHKTIKEELVKMKNDLSQNQEFITDLDSNLAKVKKTAGSLRIDPTTRLPNENEKVTKKLINKISFAREKAYDMKYLEQILDELLIQNQPDPSSPLKPRVQYSNFLGVAEAAQNPAHEGLRSLFKDRISEEARPQTFGDKVDQVPFNELYYRALNCRENFTKEEERNEEKRLADLQRRVDQLKYIERDLQGALDVRRAETEKFKEAELEKLRFKLRQERDLKELAAKERAIKELMKRPVKTVTRELTEQIDKERSQPIGGSSPSPNSSSWDKRGDIMKPLPVPPQKPERGSKAWQKDDHKKVPELTEEESIVASDSLVSDYPEHLEALRSISWMESTDSKQKKFTNS